MNDFAERDGLNELFGIGMGQAASVLNSITGSHVRLSVPSIEIGPRSRLPELLDAYSAPSVSAVNLRFHGAIQGTAGLVFPEGDACKLVRVLVGPDAPDELLAEMRTGALTEIGNIVLNGLMGAMSNVLGKHLEYSVPEYLEDSPERLFNAADPGDMVVVAGSRMEIEELRLDGQIVLVLELKTFDDLLRSVREAFASR